MLIGDAHIDIGYLVMVIHFGGLSYQGITDTGALEEHDVVLQSEGERTSAVHHSSQRNISQREIGTALTDAACVQMMFCDQHLSPSIAFTYLF